MHENAPDMASLETSRTVETEAFLWLMWGRLAFDTAIAEGRLSIKGNQGAKLVVADMNEDGG